MLIPQKITFIIFSLFFSLNIMAGTNETYIYFNANFLNIPHGSFAKKSGTNINSVFNKGEFNSGFAKTGYGLSVGLTRLKDLFGYYSKNKSSF